MQCFPLVFVVSYSTLQINFVNFCLASQIHAQVAILGSSNQSNFNMFLNTLQLNDITQCNLKNIFSYYCFMDCTNAYGNS